MSRFHPERQPEPKRTAEQREIDRTAAVELVEAATADAYIPVGSDWKNPDNVYRTVAELRRWVSERRDRGPQPGKHFAADLAALARDGRIAVNPEQRLYGRRGDTYTSLAKHAAWLAEINLSDAERAERTTVDIAEQYAKNQHDRGDMVSLWPVDTSYGSRLRDGIEPAMAAGMIVKIKGGYVPADQAESYQEILAAEEARQQRLADHHKAVRVRLHELLPEPAKTTGNRRVVEVSLDQAEWLIAQLERLRAFAVTP